VADFTHIGSRPRRGAGGEILACRAAKLNFNFSTSRDEVSENRFGAQAPWSPLFKFL
jgi:hypothetical protein